MGNNLKKIYINNALNLISQVAETNPQVAEAHDLLIQASMTHKISCVYKAGKGWTMLLDRVNLVQAGLATEFLSNGYIRTALAILKTFVGNYKIKQALATNPKTPLSSAIKFLNYLHDRDLKLVMKSRDVPSAIAAHARRILSRKGMV